MDLKEMYYEIVQKSGMSLYQLNEICIESSREVMLGKGNTNTSEVSVFFRNGKNLFSKVNAELRYSSELDNYILVFNLE